MIGLNSKLTGAALLPGDDTELEDGDAADGNVAVHWAPTTGGGEAGESLFTPWGRSEANGSSENNKQVTNMSKKW